MLKKVFDENWVKRDIYGTYIEQWVISTFSAQLSFSNFT